jgi:hypothetical protein
VIIIYHQASVNHTWNPAEKRQDYTQEKTAYPPREQNSQGRKNDAEKITQRFHSFSN